jgi:hypothetical protein
VYLAHDQYVLTLLCDFGSSSTLHKVPFYFVRAFGFMWLFHEFEYRLFLLRLVYNSSESHSSILSEKPWELNELGRIANDDLYSLHLMVYRHPSQSRMHGHKVKQDISLNCRNQRLKGGRGHEYANSYAGC